MKVFVYFNLHKKCWSIKALEGDNKGKVIGHKNQLTLIDASFKVSMAGRNRVLLEKQKNVHAGVVGQLCEHSIDFDAQVTYNPYKANHFYIKSNELPIFSAKSVSFNNRIVTAIIDN